jgi:adenylate kinase
MSFVITGNPGVGKHTVAERLSKKIGYKIIDINKIAINSGAYKKNKETFDVDVKKLKKILNNHISKKTLVVGHLAPYVLTKSKIKKVIILRKSPYKLISIYKKRKYSVKKINENLESEILGITAFDAIKNFGKTKTFQLDTTSKSILKTVQQIQEIFEGKGNEKTIDWLSLISKNNDLKKFFSY